MKTLTLIIVLLLSVSFNYAQEEKAGHSITVTIENIQNNNGNVLLSLHTEGTFMKASGIQNLESKIVDGQVSLTFENVTPGTYAIMALHDENENRKMDFQENGMPKEAYGASNNDMSFGPPQFSKAKFEMNDENLELKIIF
ncbi:DUF2141 domain-containing protein [Litoribaculum gwangyangense]